MHCTLNRMLCTLQLRQIEKISQQHSPDAHAQLSRGGGPCTPPIHSPPPNADFSNQYYSSFPCTYTLRLRWLDGYLFAGTRSWLEKVRHTQYSASSWGNFITEALRYDTHCRRISRCHLHIHTFIRERYQPRVCLPSRSWSSFYWPRGDGRLSRPSRLITYLPCILAYKPTIFGGILTLALGVGGSRHTSRVNSALCVTAISQWHWLSVYHTPRRPLVGHTAAAHSPTLHVRPAASTTQTAAAAAVV